MEAETERTRRSAAIPSHAAVILGNDALLAARPYTPAQLASACVLAGFDIIIPPSTGDEIVAAAYLDGLRGRADHTVIACACPHVRARVEESPFGGIPRVAIASPPVAAARYLRAEYGDGVLITFVGNCPGATDPAIDARFTPAGFLASLHRQGIAIEEQPDSDRLGIRWQRHLSTPGGIPARRFVARPPVDRVVREVSRDTIGDLRPQRSPVLLDVVDAGCSCTTRYDEASALEPARSPVPLFAIPTDLDLTTDSSVPRSRTSLRARDRLTPEPAAPIAAPPIVEPSMAAPHVVTPPVVAPPVVAPPVHAAPPATTSRVRAAQSRLRSDPVRTGRRSPLLVILPLAVLAGATALGVAAYATGSTGGTTVAEVDSGTATHADSGDPTANPDSSRVPADSPTTLPDPAARGRSDSVSRADTALRDSTRPGADSTARRRPRRVRAPEVMPGWLPQGQPTWSPDSLAGRRPDTGSVSRSIRRPPA